MTYYKPQSLLLCVELLVYTMVYHQLTCVLHYFTFTWPDIPYAVHHVCLYMPDPRVLILLPFNAFCDILRVPSHLVLTFIQRKLLNLLHTPTPIEEDVQLPIDPQTVCT